MDRQADALSSGEQGQIVDTSGQSSAQLAGAAHPTSPVQRETATQSTRAARPAAAVRAKSRSPVVKNDWKRALVVFCALSAAGWLVYGPAIHAPFVFDDRSSVNENPSIVKLWPLLGEAGHDGPLTPPRDNVTSGRPLVNLTLAINYYFGQTRPTGYHVFNVWAHILCAWLVWMIVRRTLQLPYFAGRLDQVAGTLAVVSALVFELHPLQTEAVEYVSQRTELLMALFYLATLAAALRYWSARTAASQGRWLLTATIACACGMACKEVMVTAPVIVLLFDRTFISNSFRRALEKSWPLYLGLSLGWLVLLALNISAPRSGSTGFSVGISAVSWWMTQTKVLLLYLKLAVWPWPLSIHYDMPYYHTLATAWPWVAPVALLIVATLILVWKNRAAGFCGACLFIILSPTLVVPLALEIAAERRMYLPMAALVPLAVVSAYTLLEWLKRRSATTTSGALPEWTPVKVTAITAGLVAAVFGLVTTLRLTAYRDLLSIWQDAAIHQPDNVLVLTSLGAQLTGAGRHDEAVQTLRRAMDLQPDTKQLAMHKQLGAALVTAGRQQEAIEPLREALRLDPSVPGVERVLGIALFNSGRGSEAIEHLERAVAAAPRDTGTWEALGAVLLTQNRPRDAIPAFVRALELNPISVSAESNLAMAYAKSDRPTEAIAAAEKAIQLAKEAGTPDAASQCVLLLQNFRQDRSAP